MSGLSTPVWPPERIFIGDLANSDNINLPMLPDVFRGPCRFRFDETEWAAYLSRLGAHSSPLDLQFLRQVPYDHFDHFNTHYPWFDIAKATTKRITMTAQEIYDQVRYFSNDPLQLWYAQFDDFYERQETFFIFRSMMDKHTWPLPPIVMVNTANRYATQCHYEYGRPLHLIEGTHRVSYLCRMLERKLVSSESTHELVLVDPN